MTQPSREPLEVILQDAPAIPERRRGLARMTGKEPSESGDMKAALTDVARFQRILERRQAELTRMLPQRDDIAIEKSADRMDEIQYASERDVAIRNVERESKVLQQVKAALRRIRNGSFGTCIECNSAISAKRLAAVPWAPCCIQCQDAADRDEPGRTDVSELLVNAA